MKFLEQIKKFFKKRKFSRDTKKNKKRLFIIEEEKSYKARRSKFKIFKAKRELLKNSFIQNKDYTFFYYFFGLILLFGAIYLLFFSQNFYVKNIYIEKKENISDINLAYTAVDDTRYKPIMLIDTHHIISRLKNYQNNIKEVNITKLFPDTLKIEIESYGTFFNTTIGEKEYQITENGTFVPMAKSPNLPDIDIYYDEVGVDKFLDYKKILDQKGLYNAKYIYDKISANLLMTKIKSINYFVVENEIHLKTDKGVFLIFDLGEDIDEQIEKLVVFNKKNPALIMNSFMTYVDLRISRRIFYCPKEKKDERNNELNCKNNLKLIYAYEL